MTMAAVRDIFRFYWACLKRAFSGWFKRVEGWAGSVSLLVAIGLLIFSSSESAEKVATAIPTFFFLGVFTLIVVTRTILAPYWLYRDERAAREALERARLPALVLSLPEPPVIQSINLHGSTSETLGGSRQTVITGWEMDVVALLCTNTGETPAHGCRARLLSVTKVLPEGEQALRIVASVELPWRKENPEASLVADIPAADKRHIWIGGVRRHGHLWLFREVKSLPIEYQQLIGEAGTYRILIQVDGENIPPQQTLLEVVAAEGPKPQSGIWRGTARVAILAQSAPRIAG